ncbi:MAG TPA: UvrD-helicase domain-containing protein [Gaiellaceae bacterium]|jgi:ATP-dependent exoDNAse (exonuclease V) beta subunit|nr:UvrD-helicase domain-containing protein [Gaiellaceae bacterium]
MNESQLAAVEARGEVFVSAGAGTGKTSVLVERFVRAVCDEGLDVDSVLVITYTRKAAAELRSRIRAALVARGRPELARELDGAWISTIHGFCARLLRAHPFEVGIDPSFHELDEEHGAVLRGEAFSRALEAFCAEPDERRLALLATYGSVRLRKMLTGVYSTLRSAGRELVLELGEPDDLDERLGSFRDAAQSLLADPGATPNHVAAAQAALDLPSLPETLIDLAALRTRGDRAASFDEARKNLERAALELAAAQDRELLQELLDLFTAEYQAAKERESALDFEDLQIFARDLLAADERVREAEQLRFRTIMVDEFQDTNALQCELIDLIAGGGTKEVFFVGDEFQSIYAFRHADVGVFRERRAAAAQRLTLSENYRSRPEVLAAVNHVFGEEFGDEYQPLAASGEFPDPVFGHPVELLVTDKEAYKETGIHWRRAEARHVARRVRELVDAGAATPGEVVLLFAAGTDAEWYEEELRSLGLPTFRATGRRYFGQQQVVDLLMYLRLLRNRYDDEALAAVLASPFIGVSNDALVLIRRHAGRRPLFTGIERSLPDPLSAEDERLVRAFKQRYERLVAASARVSLERLCELVVGEHDYDLAVLARWDGARRYANLRKLMRLARGYEEVRGRDLEGFLVFLRNQEALGAAQLEAVSEEEGANAVRLLTIHAAKGLEFKVVVVADAGRDLGGPPPSDEILALADGRFGFKIVHPISGDRKPVFDYDAVADAGREAARAERLRLYYVAMTRAIDRLLVSGAVGESRDTPIGWVLSKLECEAELAAGAGVFELERGGASFLVRVDRPAEEAPVEVAPVAGGEAQLSLFNDLPSSPPIRGWLLPELVPVPAPPLHRVRQLSYSALALFGRCSYRYYAERVARLPERRGEGPPGGGMTATEVGDAVHRVLETVDLAAPQVPGLDEVREWYPLATDGELERIGTLAGAFCASGLAARLAEFEGARPEVPFAFEHDGVLMRGRLDVLHRAGGRAFVLDFKTNVLGERTPDEVIDADYRLQRLVYALGCLKAGDDEVEVVYQFLERPDAVVSATFTRDDRQALEEELSAAIARINAGQFAPTPGEFTCSGCPALDLVCAGPRLHGGELDGREALVGSYEG